MPKKAITKEEINKVNGGSTRPNPFSTDKNQMIYADKFEAPNVNGIHIWREKDNKFSFFFRDGVDAVRKQIDQLIETIKGNFQG